MYILENNFLKSDLPELLYLYDNLDKEMQAKVYDLALTYISDIIEDTINVTFQLKNKLLHSRELDIESRMNLLIAMLPDLDVGYVKGILQNWGLQEYIKIFEERKRPKFKINDMNMKMLEAFKEKGWIADYNKDEKRDGFYKITRRKF